jgi:hypothetical protein
MVEREQLFSDLDAVSGIVASLESDDNVGFVRQEIDYLPLALVPPLRAYHDQ